MLSGAHLNSPGSHVGHEMSMDGDGGEAQLVDAALSHLARSSPEDQAELGRVQPGVLDGERTVLAVQFPLVVLSLAVLVQTEHRHLAVLQAVAVEEDPDHVLAAGLLADQETLVLALVHQDAVVDSHQAALLHLQGELALPPGVAGGQLGRPGLVVQDHGAGDGLAHHHVHAEIKQLGVPVLHFVLAKQLPY